jgi:hypothetical protein
MTKPSHWISELPADVHHQLYTNSHRDSVSSSADRIDRITHALSYLLLLEVSRPELLMNMSLATKFARLMCVFLIGKLCGVCVCA